MKKQIYTEKEFTEKIHQIETTFSEKVCIYNITIGPKTESKVVELMSDHISELCYLDHEIQVYEWKVIYNNILIIVDFQDNRLYLKYIEGQIDESDIDLIVDSFSFLDPKYYDDSNEQLKTKEYLDMISQRIKVKDNGYERIKYTEFVPPL